MILLKQSTSTTRRFGPFLDETDGKTQETALSIAQADIRLSKAGGAFAQSNDVGGATHDEKGWYYLTLDATDTATLGSLEVNIHVTGALPVWKEFMVVPANVYDSLVAGTDYLDAATVEVGSTAQTSIADAILKRDWTGMTGEASRSILNALRFLRNKWSISGTTLTVTKEDDSTSAWTAALTATAGADPITEIDPT